MNRDGQESHVTWPTITMESCRAIANCRHRLYNQTGTAMYACACTVGHALLTRNCLRSDETNARNPAWFETGFNSLDALDATVHLANCWKKEINELSRSSNKTSIICAGVAQFVTQDFVQLIRTAWLWLSPRRSKYMYNDIHDDDSRENAAIKSRHWIALRAYDTNWRPNRRKVCKNVAKDSTIKSYILIN